MKKIVSVCALLLIAASPLSLWAEWTGDKGIGYYKNSVIKGLHFGQIDR